MFKKGISWKRSSNKNLDSSPSRYLPSDNYTDIKKAELEAISLRWEADIEAKDKAVGILGEIRLALPLDHILQPAIQKALDEIESCRYTDKQMLELQKHKNFTMYSQMLRKALSVGEGQQLTIDPYNPTCFPTGFYLREMVGLLEKFASTLRISFVYDANNVTDSYFSANGSKIATITEMCKAMSSFYNYDKESK